MKSKAIRRGWWAGIAMIIVGIPVGAWGMDHMGHESSHGHNVHIPTPIHEHEEGVLKKVSVDDGSIIVNFYLETIDAHKKAMEKMGMTTEEMGEDMKKEMESATHHLSVSFLDAKTKKIIEKAEGTITVTGPAGTSAKNNLHWMEEMKHFGSCLELKDKGKYRIMASFAIDGKERKAGFEYTLE